MKVGDTLIAIDPCIMTGTRKKSLTVGNKYIVIGMEMECLEIIDDFNETHFFRLVDWRKYFIKKEDNVLKLLREVDEV